MGASSPSLHLLEFETKKEAIPHRFANYYIHVSLFLFFSSLPPRAVYFLRFGPIARNRFRVVVVDLLTLLQAHLQLHRSADIINVTMLTWDWNRSVVYRIL